MKPDKGSDMFSSGKEARGHLDGRSRVPKTKPGPLPTAPAKDTGHQGIDPEKEAEANSRLLAPVDIIRDPLHGDIRYTALERFVIDSQEFQRLRNVAELALTVVAYPGAVHTRFLHSIGTLHVCSKMIDICNYNADLYARLALPGDPLPLRIPVYGQVLARLCALMHDMAHVPFGHTLEKEGKLFDRDEWKDPGRVSKIFGEGSSFRNSFLEFAVHNLELTRPFAVHLLSDLKVYLTTPREKATDLPYPFVHDLVGNTICADLIDYVQRDMYFCGLSERFGDRFLTYIAVVPLKKAKGEDGKELLMAVPTPNGTGQNSADISTGHETKKDGPMNRLVLMQYRYNERGNTVRKHDVIAEAIDLVRRRLGIAEKLYFHRTKLAASAMLITAVHSQRMTIDDLWDCSDHEVLSTLAQSGDPRVKHIGEALLQRNIFKPIYRVSFIEEQENTLSDLLWGPGGAYERFSAPEKRQALIMRLERIVGLAKNPNNPEQAQGTIALSCPDKGMNLKAFDMLVLPDPKSPVKKLQEWKHRQTEQEIAAIQSAHKHLWRLEVLVDSKMIGTDSTDIFTCELAGAIAKEVRLPNEIEIYGHGAQVSLDELENKVSVKAALTRRGVDPSTLQIRQMEELLTVTFSRMSPEESERYLDSKLEQFKKE